jgi:hypothetical protein
VHALDPRAISGIQWCAGKSGRKGESNPLIGLSRIDWNDILDWATYNALQKHDLLATHKRFLHLTPMRELGCNALLAASIGISCRINGEMLTGIREHCRKFRFSPEALKVSACLKLHVRVAVDVKTGDPRSYNAQCSKCWRVNASRCRWESRECPRVFEHRWRPFDRDKSREIVIARAISRVAQRSSGQEAGSTSLSYLIVTKERRICPPAVTTRSSTPRTSRSLA